MAESILDYNIGDDQWPIVYDEQYNVKFFGLQNFHVFDAKKWRNIVKNLEEAGMVSPDSLAKPPEATKDMLRLVHTDKYLKSLKWSPVVAMAIEVPILAVVPNFLIQRNFLKPMRLQTGGSVLAGKLALERGWAINIGGGFHHCSSGRGEGFCMYADITLLIRILMMENRIKNAMILDLDAHQGNGYEHDFLNVPEVYIMDMYNKMIYPRDNVAKRAIRKRVEFRSKMEDLQYMVMLRNNFRDALDEFTPDILVYNAGTDILDGDPLGRLCISEIGIIKRDEFVFKTCKERHIPIVMLTSGGYVRKTARIIAESILNLHRKGYIYGPTDAKVEVTVDELAEQRK